MKYQWIDEYLLGKAGVTKDLQKDWNWIRYHIGGKMFAAVCLDRNNEPVYITMKLEPTEGEFLRQQYEDIIPGYYMNKQHWNSVKAEGNVSDELLKEMFDKAYSIVLSGFSKKKQKEILMLSCCGTDCSACYCYGEMCKGCNEHKGKVFHAPEGKACPIYECAKNKSCLYSCRECAKIPCEIWYKTRDPKFSDEEFQKDVEERVQRLRRTIK